MWFRVIFIRCEVQGKEGRFLQLNYEKVGPFVSVTNGLQLFAIFGVCHTELFVPE